MHPRRTLLLASLLLVLAPAPAEAVADDAQLAFEMLFVTFDHGADDAPQDVQVLVDLTATDDAPEGRIEGHVDIRVQPLNGTGPSVDYELPFAADVGPPSSTRRYVRHSLSIDVTFAPGLYNVTARLWPSEGAGPWDERWLWYQAGYGPHIGSGWGHARFPPASSFDADGDGETDVWLEDNATRLPLERALDVYEQSRGFSSTEGQPTCGRNFWIQLPTDGGEPVTDIAVSAALVERLMPERHGILRMDTQTQGGEAPAPVDGRFRTTLGLPSFSTRSDAVFFSRTCPEPGAFPAHVWGHGFRTTANVTHWDLDEDGAMDVRFWHTDATSVESARNQTVEARRGQELVLIAQAHVEHRTTRRILTFELARPGGGHEGAWVEIQDAAGMFRQLLGAADNASVSYHLSLPANESFVEHHGNTTWAWIGHFSTQTLTVILDEAMGGSREVESTTVDRSSSSASTGADVPQRRSPIPGPGTLAALAAVVAALLVVRKTLRRR